MFLETALLGVIIGWIRGGRLSRLGQASLPGWPLVLLPAIIQVAIWLDFSRDWGHLAAAAPYLHVFSYLPLLSFVYLNRRRPGIVIVGAGILLNLVVICSNGGLMPVAPAGLAPELREELISGAGSPLHAAVTAESSLVFLGDIIRVPYGKYRIISIGDLIMAAGICLFIQQGMQVYAPAKEK